MAVMAVGAAAPAYGTTAKTVLQIAMEEVPQPDGTVVGSVRGAAVSETQPYCEQKRKIELFIDGKKFGTTESDRYGGWSFSIKPMQSGRYVAKTKKSQLPNKTVCSEATSKALIAP